MRISTIDRMVYYDLVFWESECGFSAALLLGYATTDLSRDVELEDNTMFGAGFQLVYFQISL